MHDFNVCEGFCLPCQATSECCKSITVAAHKFMDFCKVRGIQTSIIMFRHGTEVEFNAYDTE